MNDKKRLLRKIHSLDFAIHEMVLFLDTHPVSKKAMELLKVYKQRRKECIAQYEEKYGPYIETAKDVPVSGCWQWLDSPWPWENGEV
mgnify:CR=1 FL=1